MRGRGDRLEAALAERDLDRMLVTDLTNVRYLTGFTGTNGAVVCGPGLRVFLTDFRYTERAAAEVSEWETVTVTGDWLAGIAERGHPLQLDVPETAPRVLADPALLERVIANLVDNAVAWSPANVPVRIEAGAVGDDVHLRVVDRGPGIPVDARDRVFQPFQRLGDSPNGMGVGLGLAVARGFVDAMGGELTIDDTPGGGTTMTVVLPAVVE